MALLDFFKNPTSVIAIDTAYKTVRFYSLSDKGAAIKQEAESFKETPFGEEFYEKFDAILKTHREKNPAEQLQAVSLVLPDSAVITDTVKVPAMKNAAARDKSLRLALESLYKNNADFEYRSFIGAENKQFSTFGVVGIKKEIIARLKSICLMNKIIVKSVTYASAATVNSALTLNPKLKGKSFMLLDIKESSSVLAFTVKGKAFGFYNLPFGYSILGESGEVKEKNLFDRAAAKALVNESEKRAKARLAAVGASPAAAAQPKTDGTAEISKIFEQPEDKDSVAESEAPEITVDRGILYRNFSIFTKWAESVAIENVGIVSLGAPECIVLNMPREYDSLIETANADGGALQYIPLTEVTTMRDITDNLDVYGGLFVKAQGKMNNF